MVLVDESPPKEGAQWLESGQTIKEVVTYDTWTNVFFI
jgi:hypothetical protein